MTSFTVTPGLEHLLDAYTLELNRDFEILATLMRDAQADVAFHLHAMAGKCAMMGDTTLADHLYTLEKYLLKGEEHKVSQAYAALLLFHGGVH